MIYSEITVTVITSKNRGKFDADTLLYRLSFTGKDGEWDSSGSFADVYSCDGLLVGLSPFNNRPMFIASTLNNMIDRLKEKTKCENIKISPGK